MLIVGRLTEPIGSSFERLIGRRGVWKGQVGVKNDQQKDQRDECEAPEDVYNEEAAERTHREPVDRGIVDQCGRANSSIIRGISVSR